MDQGEFERRAVVAGRDHTVWVRRNLAQDKAELEALDAALRGEGNGSRAGELTGELGEDRQVRVQPDPIQTTDAERGERPLVLQPPELALDGGAAPVELAVAGRLARDQRVQAARPDPH